MSTPFTAAAVQQSGKLINDLSGEHWYTPGLTHPSSVVCP